VEDEEEDEEADPKDDVLLMEAGNVLVDALLLKQQRFAVHSQESE
jgi:carboxyl-terminal processing protease